MALKIVDSQMGRVISGPVSIHFVANIHSQMGEVLSGLYQYISWQLYTVKWGMF